MNELSTRDLSVIIREQKTVDCIRLGSPQHRLCSTFFSVSDFANFKNQLPGLSRLTSIILENAPSYNVISFNLLQSGFTIVTR